MRTIICALWASLLVGTFAEFKGGLRGPRGYLAVHNSLAASPTDSLQAPESQGIQTRFFNLFRRRAAQPVKEEDVNDAIEVTDFKSFSIMNLAEMITSFCIWLVLYCFFAWYYHSYVRFYAPVDEKAEEKEQSIGYADYQNFKTGLFSFQALDICFWSCFCPGIRWADTYSKLDIHSYWNGFFLMSALYAIGFIPLCTVPCYLIVVFYMTYYRQEFRKKFNFGEQGGSTYLADCCTLCWCMCCAVNQEASHVRSAITVEHPAIDLSIASVRLNEKD